MEEGSQEYFRQIERESADPIYLAFDDAVGAYAEKFGKTHMTTIGLPYRKLASATKEIEGAVASGKPFSNDADFRRAAGINEPPPDAVL